MNRIEQKLAMLKEKKENALVTYLTAGLPDMDGTKKLMFAMEEAGADVIELGIPFSDPVADGQVIQDASYRSICLGTGINAVFQMMEEIRSQELKIPVVFKLYYNTILHYGMKNFAEKCKETGVDGLILPDLPIEEQEQLRNTLEEMEASILIQFVSSVSGERIPAVLKHARGFVLCIPSTETSACLQKVKEISDIPVMMEFGDLCAGEMEPLKAEVDGIITESHFVQYLEEHNYNIDAAKEYCRHFKQTMLGQNAETLS